MISGDIKWSTAYNTSDESRGFLDKDGEIIVIDSQGDEITLIFNAFSYEFGEEQKTQLKSLVRGQDYWLASRCNACSDERADYRVLYSNCDEMDKFIGNALLCDWWNASCPGEKGVRAIVLIPSE